MNDAAAAAGEGLKIRLVDPSPIPSIASHLKQPGKGLVTLVVDTPLQQVEIALPHRVLVTPQLKSSLSALRGVADIETV